MLDYTCLIFGKDDSVLDVHSIQGSTLSEAINDAVALTLIANETRGFQLWSAGKMVYAQLTKGGIPWTQAVPISA